ncbi:MAG: sigma-54-dependent Fis family transcriptional regulator [Gammaproteobacteria bacterium]|nr:sigma-54-dependent Fis family transcriptional regulator [Gammaproteobacteria bacterium]
MSAHILVVDDEPDICGLMKEILEDEGYTVSIAKTAEAARRVRQEKNPDLIILDIWMPDLDGISLLREWRENGLMDDTPVIMMSGHGTVETAVEATRLGAYDFIEKPVSLSKLLITLRRALEMLTLKRENLGLRKSAEPVIHTLGHSKVMVALREQVKRMTQTDASVIIIGESGTGRSLFARYLHQHSPRQQGPFVNVRIAGMSSENQAIELFGKQVNSNIARLQQAHSGTLYIKDITDMDSAVQGRLLSALENGEFTPDGGNEPIPIDVRIIAATTYDLEQAVHANRLRQDVYYHLNVVPLHISPLREHCEDVPELLEYYVNLFVTQENLPYRRFTVAAQNRLRNYHWPGNVRELNNLVQRLLILGKSTEIDTGEIEPALNTQPRAVSASPMPFFDLPLREAREQFERAYIEHHIQETGGNITKVAARVGLERTHLYRKLRSLDIDPKEAKK